MTIRSEAAKGRVEGLTALRDRLADALDDPTSTDVRSLSAVAGQLRKTLAEIESLTETGIRLSDGSTLEADLIVQCTGYQSMHETVAKIVSRDVADKVGPCWGLGSGVRNDPGPWQGELRNMYKPTAQEALWFHGGNLALSRYYSKILALQLKARMENIPTPVYQAPY